jgi:dGTPase
MSNPADGILFSPKYLELIDRVKAFNYEHIYLHPRMRFYNAYAKLVIHSIYEVLKKVIGPDGDPLPGLDELQRAYPDLGGSYRYWLQKYSDFEEEARADTKFANQIVYHLQQEKDRLRSVVDYISSMTDQYAIRIFAELTRF